MSCLGEPPMAVNKRACRKALRILRKALKKANKRARAVLYDYDRRILEAEIAGIKSSIDNIKNDLRRGYYG